MVRKPTLPLYITGNHLYDFQAPFMLIAFPYSLAHDSVLGLFDTTPSQARRVTPTGASTSAGDFVTVDVQLVWIAESC